MSKKPNKNNDKIVKEYIATNISCCDLSKKYGLSESGMSSLLKRNNVKIRQIQGICNKKYSVNQNYFEKIDSEDKAYFLGLLYADGCNNKEGFILSLQERDGKILEILKEKIKYSGPIKFRKKAKEGWQNQLSISVYGVKISKDLNKLGCGPKKSLILDFPTENQVPNYLMNHFIRGCFDGDGCFYINKKKKSKNSISIVSSYNFILKLKTFLLLIGIESNNYQIGKVECLEIKGGKNGKISFLEWLYNDSSIFIERKFKTQSEIREYYEKA